MFFCSAYGKEHRRQNRPINLNVTLLNNTLVWISSIADIPTHFERMTRFRSYAISFGRSLTVVTYQHDLYGRSNTVNICEIFKLPPNVACLEAHRDDVVKNISCSIVPTTNNKNLHGEMFGLPANMRLDNLPLVNWENSPCVIGETVPVGMHSNIEKFVITFSNSSELLYRKARYLLSLDHVPSYAALRWERFHLSTLCQDIWKEVSLHKYDESVPEDLKLNCGTAKNLISMVHSLSSNIQITFLSISLLSNSPIHFFSSFFVCTNR